MTSSTGEQPWTVLRLINWTKDFFAERDVESPRLAAEVLLAHVLQCQRLALYTQFDKVPTDAQRTQFRELVKRASAGEPTAYLVGHRDFYSLDLIVTPDVLIPRPETEILVDKALEHLRPMEAPRCWDICTGSGAVALAVAANAPKATVLATDISKAALDVAARNAEKHALSERVSFAEADLLSRPAGWADVAFDVVTANPPYVTTAEMADLPACVTFEPASALVAGDDGLDFVRPILDQAPQVLVEGGVLAVEIGHKQAAAVWDLANQSGQFERIEFIKDAGGVERTLVAYRK